jgi:hypothetical protein
MDNAARLAIYKSQVDNVRSLIAARTQVRRAINHALRIGNDPMVDVQTKILALVFCAWAESNFLKVIHTPHGFTLGEIQQIKRIWSNNGIAEGWQKCIQVALAKVPAQRSNFVPNARKKLTAIVREFVLQPSMLRNKIAHGQWVKALNGANTATNEALTQELSHLDITKITIWFRCHALLADIVEGLIESPKKFVRDYWALTVELEEFVETSRGWSMEDLRRKLMRKPAKISHKESILLRGSSGAN